jgi:hypothetical protein
MAKTRKSIQDLLFPGAASWERWTGPVGDSGTKAADFAPGAVTAYGRDAQSRLLALPLSHVWVLPAWLQGEEGHLRDMAVLHLERLGVHVSDGVNGLQVRRIAARDGAHLVCLIALKDVGIPTLEKGKLPDEVVLSADCLPLPNNTMVIYRELGRLVLAITHEAQLIYASPLSSRELDGHALGEVNHLCLQLGFQGVLAQVQNIVLWLDGEGDLEEVRRITGLTAVRLPCPAPIIPALGRSTLLPAELLVSRHQIARASRIRLFALMAGFAVAAAVATLAVLISLATQDRDLLRERVAELTPQASQVLDQKRRWEEAAPAVDPTHFPMQVLLDCMVPAAASEVSMTHFEWTPEQLLMRGRMPSPSLALQYAKEVTEVKGLSHYKWETPAPTIASDNSATFEVKGGVQR